MTSEHSTPSENSSTDTNLNTNDSETTHFCDEHITYDETAVTLHFAVDDDWEETLHGTCDVCGRTLEINVVFDVEMMSVVDSDSNTVLHEY